MANTCPCTGCKARIAATTVMCQPHWDLLPLASQMTVWGLFCKEGRESPAFQEALGVAIEIVGVTKVQRGEVFEGKKPIQFSDAPSGKYALLGKESK